MNEAAAREVLLVRAVEMADAAEALLSAQDRGHAGRAAAGGAGKLKTSPH